CYRLIKVRSGQTGAFGVKNGQGGDYQAVMILLGVITGAPSVSLYFIEELEMWVKLKKAGTLHELLDQLDKNADVNSQQDWLRVKEFLKAHVALNDPARLLAALLAVTPRVSRYSFRVARIESARQKKTQAAEEKSGTRQQQTQAKI
ncbi:MAG TPA: hypothetical protein VJT74_09185, partial [Pyrinomonadaceae bacterium]|nr:hypothetical protein [Pyrinomonadaceae bacterium]